MGVYIDKLMNWGWKLRGNVVRSCHMIADTPVELHSMAKKIGLKLKWFQPKSFPHYDLTESRRTIALQHGVQELDRREFVMAMRSIREKFSNNLEFSYDNDNTILQDDESEGT